MGYNGKRVIVRKRVNGQWQITKKGEDEYRYHRNEYVVHVPVRRVVHTNGAYTWANGSGLGDTFPVELSNCALPVLFYFGAYTVPVFQWQGHTLNRKCLTHQYYYSYRTQIL